MLVILNYTLSTQYRSTRVVRVERSVPLNIDAITKESLDQLKAELIRPYSAAQQPSVKINSITFP